MNPLAKRIVIHGLLTAAVLGVVGLMLAELGGLWMASHSGNRPGSAELNAPVEETLRYKIPLTMAIWGFAFVAVGELILHRIRSRRPPTKPPEPQPDDAERLLNELLAQAEAKAALENQKTENREQRTEDRGEKPETSEQKPDGTGQEPEVSHR
ncbi:MAG: hypothetical protein L0241_17350 [Planctomycetia bacterium]|nr:hypothetical protein [Planctomycetia bacterium]